MTETQHLSDTLEVLFSRPDNGWFMPLTTAIEGLTARQAAQVPAPHFNSVWAVVNHVRFCAEVVLLSLRGQKVDRQALGTEDDWPPVHDPDDESAWRDAKERTITINQEVAIEIAQLTDEQLEQSIAPGHDKRWQVFHGLIAHNSYHTCEIVSIRHMLGLWLEDT